jgi:hypothetical protein
MDACGFSIPTCSTLTSSHSGRDCARHAETAQTATAAQR